MSLFSKISGVVTSFFQIGGPAGPGFSDTSTTVLSAQNSSQSAYAIVRGATPLADNDYTTKAYVDEAYKPLIVTAQSNAATSLIANSGSEHYIVVSASGSGAAAAYVLGDVLWDDGTSTGNVGIISAVVGASIVVTTALSGGTDTFTANSEYVWTGTTWLNLAPSVAGAQYTINMAVGTAASQSSTTIIPANAIITACLLSITTGYTAAATISVGQTGTTALLMGTGDNDPQIIDEYVNEAQTSWGASPLAVLVTVGNAPSTGVGTVAVTYTLPLS